MAQFEIDIEKYLTETEKKELVIEVFKKQVKKELFKSVDGTIQSDSEIQRIIGNISHQIVMNEVQKHIPDCEQMIKDKTIETLSKSDFSYQVFKKKDVWDRDESLAITYINETVRTCKETFQKRIKDTIDNYDMSKEISEEVSNVFEEMAGNFNKLAELFFNK